MGILLRLAVGIVAALAVFACSSCTPHGHAVGDTASRQQDVAHDADPGAPLTVAVIGATSGGLADPLVTDALEADGLEPYYVQCAGMRDEPAAADAAAQGIRDAVHRHVKLVMVLGLMIADDTQATWTGALEDARAGGIPVVLVDPVDLPADGELYAAVFAVNDRMRDAEPIGQAARQVIDDAPHGRTIPVTTIVG